MNPELPNMDVPFHENFPREALRIDEDGWLLGPHDELILWIPFELRNSATFSQREAINNIDFRNFKCGIEWTQCWRELGEKENSWLA